MKISVIFGTRPEAIKLAPVILARKRNPAFACQVCVTAQHRALAAFYRRIPLGRVEAGLRTWNLNAPWPEEANRVLTSRLAALHFAPTESAAERIVAACAEYLTTA
jgi:UDP-N-acetylglucosamine 2-epimerase (non-hydrolysing)